MAHTNVKNLYVGTPQLTGGIWLVPQRNVILPTNAYDPIPASAGNALGGVSDEGVTYSSERQTDKRKDWNGEKVRSLQTSKDDTFELTFLEFLNPRVMGIVHGADNVTVSPASIERGTHIAVRDVSTVLDHGAYIIDTIDGKVKKRRVIPDAQPSKIEPVNEKNSELAVYKVTFDLYPDSQGATNYQYTLLDDKIVPSTWDVAVTGSAGTIVWSVDGVPTSAQTYNVATSALKTALEGLSTVGAGNATVTGTAGTSYHVVLANGGVLTAVGTGGATAVVTPA